MRGLLLFLFAILAVLLTAACWLYFRGSVVLRDASDRAVRAEFVTASGSIELQRYPGGIFFGVPSADASLRVTCASGRTVEFGYVTSHLSVWRLGGDLGC
ncbi:hypothetical protein OF829_01225 [Sphingomonas sp. LB-2]|uniref:hypothetical protein n=1 Tax=Sphingomonas caeni TaxID=2984949 RepID=UPI00222E8465|nr:hypothetical protein [Sphingomonas caeni]MCW3845844.1 hypothetical protein [Sphingomonas caeni]